MNPPRSAVVSGALFISLAACGWFVAGMAPFGVESSAFTFSVAAAMLAVSAVAGHAHSQAFDLRVRGPNLGRRRDGASVPPSADASADTSLVERGVVAWLLAVLLFVAVELWELFHVPRSTYPTLSSLVNEVLGPGHRVARAAAFVCWAACGLIVSSRPFPSR